MAGRTDYDKGERIGRDIAAVARVPGGIEMLATMAADELGGGAKRLRLFSMGGPVGYDSGGLAQAAETTRAAGRGDDEMLLHVSPEEYEALVAMWGEPEINPNTGLPEYGFLSKLWKKVKKGIKSIVKSPIFGLVAPTLLNVFAPGLGSAIGGALGATGKAASVVGNTAIRAGLGAAAGGKEGAISGALSGLTSGGVGSKLGKSLGLSGEAARIGGDALLGGTASALRGRDFGSGALQQAVGSVIDPAFDKMVEGGVRRLTGTQSQGAGVPSVSDGFAIPSTEDVPLGDVAGVLGVQPPAAPSRSLGQRAVDWVKENPWKTAAGATALAAMMGSGRRGDTQSPSLPDSFNQPLPNLSFDRSAMPVSDYYTYGQSGGEQSFFDRNAIPSGQGTGNSALDVPGTPTPGSVDQSQQPRRITSGGMTNMVQRAMLQAQGWTFDQSSGMMYPPGYFGLTGFGPRTAGAARGGRVYRLASGGHVQGPGSGRSDDIPAMLSDGEYVVDAESVALLGDGSVAEGSRRLDDMRKRLRKHKGGALSKGQFTPAAKTPENYMAEGGRAKKGGKPALNDLKALATKLERAVSSGDQKRVKEIAKQLNALSGGTGTKMVAELSRGGNVGRVIRDIVDERELRGGPEERRARERHGGKGRRLSDHLSDEELAKIAEELGGFAKGSKFIERFRRRLAAERVRDAANTGE